MPCFSCSCFRDGKGRSGEKLNGGRGYCELWDQEFWRGHECNDFSPVWYAAKPEAKLNEYEKGFMLRKMGKVLDEIPCDEEFEESLPEQEEHQLTEEKAESSLLLKLSELLSQPPKQTKKRKHKLRTGMTIWMSLCIFLAIIYGFISVAEPGVISMTLFFGFLGFMFLILGYSPKGNKYLLNKQSGLTKGKFVAICVFLAFLLLTVMAIIMPFGTSDTILF